MEIGNVPFQANDGSNSFFEEVGISEQEGDVRSSVEAEEMSLRRSKRSGSHRTPIPPASSSSKASSRSKKRKASSHTLDIKEEAKSRPPLAMWSEIIDLTDDLESVSPFIMITHPFKADPQHLRTRSRNHCR